MRNIYLNTHGNRKDVLIFKRPPCSSTKAFTQSIGVNGAARHRKEEEKWDPMFKGWGSGMVKTLVGGQAYGISNGLVRVGWWG